MENKIHIGRAQCAAEQSPDTSATITRRGFLQSSVVAAPAIIGLADAASGQTKPALRLKPPALQNPTTYNATTAGGEIKLGAGDHIVKLPSSPVTTTFRINGQSLARNIVVIGGEVRPALKYNKSTMRLLNNTDWALWARVGFTGATGGTFKLVCADTGPQPRPQTADIPWNATPAQIKQAINTALGYQDACFTVDGPNTPGGPWKIVPGNNARLGRCSLVLTGLTGAPVAVERTFNNVSTALDHGIIIQHWTHTLHLEGVYANVATGIDGINLWTHHATAIAQLANCHFAGLYHVFHDDWIHPDGAQAFNGPAKLFAENCDFISKGGNGFIGQPREISSPSKLESLYDWWFRRCLFRAYKSDDDPRRLADNSQSFWIEEDYPVNNRNEAGWRALMDGCIADRLSWATRARLLSEPDWRYYGHKITTVPTGWEPVPSGLTIKPASAVPFFCDPRSRQCGIGYVSPGYTGQPLPQVTKRLQGETVIQ